MIAHQAEELFAVQPRRLSRLSSGPKLYTTKQFGKSRIQNLSAVGYLVYIGVNQYPDLSLPPHTIQSTLPIVINYPTNGNTLYVVVRYRNSFGLISNNIVPTIITPSGGSSPPIGPTNIVIYAQPDSSILINFNSPGSDADKVKVWVGVTLPNIGVDTPAYFDAIDDVVNFGTYSPGTYYVVIGLFRTTDAQLSPTVTKTITFDALPDNVTGVVTEFLIQ